MRGKQAKAIRYHRVSLIVLPLLLAMPGPTAATSALPVVYDFVEKFPTAEVQTDTKRIQFADEDSRGLLIQGWAEPNGKNPTRWGIGDESSVRFFLSVPSDLSIRFRCSPFHFKDAP